MSHEPVQRSRRARLRRDGSVRDVWPNRQARHQPDWYDEALCAETDPDAFFPEKGESTSAAKELCRACTARNACLDYALDNDERFGVWGGLSERERRRLPRRSAGPGTARRARAWASSPPVLGADDEFR